MRMSRSPQNGGFHRCTGGGPLPAEALAAPAMVSRLPCGVPAFSVMAEALAAPWRCSNFVGPICHAPVMDRNQFRVRRFNSSLDLRCRNGRAMSEARTGPAEPATLPALASSRPEWIRASWWMLAILLMMGLLLAPAIFNGFPIIFADTGGYLLRPIEGQLELGRSALYGAFLLAGIAFDFWPVVIVQAAMTCWIIVLTLRAFNLGKRPGAALVVVLTLTLA